VVWSGGQLGGRTWKIYQGRKLVMILWTGRYYWGNLLTTKCTRGDPVCCLPWQIYRQKNKASSWTHRKVNVRIQRRLCRVEVRMECFPKRLLIGDGKITQIREVVSFPKYQANWL
jgi:hypothetical protein